MSSCSGREAERLLYRDALLDHVLDHVFHIQPAVERGGESSRNGPPPPPPPEDVHPAAAAAAVAGGVSIQLPHVGVPRPRRRRRRPDGRTWSAAWRGHLRYRHAGLPSSAVTSITIRAL